MPNYEGQTVADAIQTGLNALSLTKAEVDIKILEEGKKGFLGIGKKAARVSLTPLESSAVAETQPNVQVAEKVEKQVTDTSSKGFEEKLADDQAITELALYLTNITNELDAPALVKVKRNKDIITFQLEGDKPGLLIGKHGKVLNALQYLAQVFVHRIAENKLTVVVNVGDYRERREATLERLAHNTADKVMRTGQPVFLEPMPAFERKQIHAFLTNNTEVKTHSEGDEPFRYLVVELAKR